MVLRLPGSGWRQCRGRCHGFSRCSTFGARRDRATTAEPSGFSAARFVRCDMCGRPLTGSWSKGRNGHYAYYHCQRQCRAVNVSKAALEGAFVDELALLQPTPGYMRLVKDRILHVWEQRRAEANDRTAEQQRRVGAIQQKMDKLDESTSRPTAGNATSCARNLRSRRLTTTPSRSTNSTCRASWRSQNAFCRAPQTCGCNPRSITSSDCSSCSFLRELRSTETDSIEPL